MTALRFKIKLVLMISVLLSAVIFGSFAHVAPAMSINANCQNPASFADGSHWQIAKRKNAIKKPRVRIRFCTCPFGRFNRKTTPQAKPNRLSQISVLGKIVPFLIAHEAPSKSEIGNKDWSRKMKK